MLSKSLRFLIFTVIVSYVVLKFLGRNLPKHPYVGLSTSDLIEKYGYPVETHHVTTKDGYILELQRIPYGTQKTTKKRVPILLVPGILQSAWDFVHLGTNSSLSFLLADKGYDVWLGNVRGTTPSRKHTTLDPDTNPEFWNFNVHQIGIYDIPAFIDHILETTNQDSLHYVGYSQGSTGFFIMGSEKPQYLKKIKLMTAVAPALFMNNPGSPVLSFLADNWKTEQKILNFLDVWELCKQGNLFTSWFQYVCNENSILLNVCNHQISVLFGYSEEENNQDVVSLTVSNTPTGVSSQQIIHIFQIMQSGHFQKYDFGVEGNLEKYGQEDPPRYNLSKVTTPVALYYSGNDWVINEENIERLYKQLPNVMKKYRVPSETFNHYDFLTAKNVGNLVYNSVLEELLKY